MKHITLEPDQMLFQENDSSDLMYYVREGEIRLFTIVNGEQKDLARIAAGDVFGELGLILGERRTAWAAATQPSRLVGMDRRELFMRIQKDPKFAARMVKRLAVKLHGANQVVKEEVSLRRSVEIAYGKDDPRSAAQRQAGSAEDLGDTDLGETFSEDAE